MTQARSNSPISGTRKAAILVTVLGEEAAALIYRQLPAADVQAITAEVASLDSVPAELAQQVLEEYQQQAGAHRFLIQGGADYATRLVQKAFGDDSAKELVQKAAQTQQKGGSKLDWLQKTDPQQLASFLEKEQPQTSAIVLSHIEPRQASLVLAKLSSETGIEIVKRMAQLRQVAPEVTETISQVLNQKLKSSSVEKKPAAVPIGSVPDLMNQLDAATSKAILEAIERENAGLAEEIRNLMFTFEDLLHVPEAGLRDWVAAVDKKTLALALKGASEPVKEHIFKAMSSRAVEMMKEDMEVLGRVRAKDVAKAQQEAIATARQLEGEGKIVLRAEGEDEFVA